MDKPKASNQQPQVKISLCNDKIISFEISNHSTQAIVQEMVNIS